MGSTKSVLHTMPGCVTLLLSTLSAHGPDLAALVWYKHFAHTSLIFLHLLGPVTSTVFHPVGSNVTSVAEDEVMRILVLIRNFLPARDQVVKGDWDVPAVAVESWDLMDKTVGTVGGGRIGYHMMKRLRVSLALMLT